MHQMIYHSRPVEIDNDHLLAEHWRHIAAAARRRNALHGVTGYLLFDRHAYLGILEGPRDEIEKTFVRIRRDPRHHDIVVTYLNRVDRRSFDDWGAGSAIRTHPVDGIFHLLGLDGGFHPEQLGALQAIELARYLSAFHHEMGHV